MHMQTYAWQTVEKQYHCNSPKRFNSNEPNLAYMKLRWNNEKIWNKFLL
jgi:hypothetical protein